MLILQEQGKPLGNTLIALWLSHTQQGYFYTLWGTAHW